MRFYIAYVLLLLWMLPIMAPLALTFVNEDGSSVIILVQGDEEPTENLKKDIDEKNLHKNQDNLVFALLSLNNDFSFYHYRLGKSVFSADTANPPPEQVS